jgi:hypothetical protein
LCRVSAEVVFTYKNAPTAATDEFIRKSRKYLGKLEKRMMMPSWRVNIDDYSVRGDSLAFTEE